jgi:hypothetical protein
MKKPRSEKKKRKPHCHFASAFLLTSTDNIRGTSPTKPNEKPDAMCDNVTNRLAGRETIRIVKRRSRSGAETEQQYELPPLLLLTSTDNNIIRM